MAIELTLPTIGDEWRSYLDAEVPKNASPDVVMLLQQAFYGGAVAVVGRLGEAYRKANIVGVFEEIATTQKDVQCYAQGMVSKNREGRVRRHGQRLDQI